MYENLSTRVDKVQQMLAESNARISEKTTAKLAEIAQEAYNIGETARREIQLLNMDISTMTELADFSVGTQEDYNRFSQLLTSMEEDAHLPSWQEIADLDSTHPITFAYRARTQNANLFVNFPDHSFVKIGYIDTTKGTLQVIPESERIINTSYVRIQEAPQPDTPETFLSMDPYKYATLYGDSPFQQHYTPQQLAQVAEVIKNPDIPASEIPQEVKDFANDRLQSAFYVDSPERLQWYARLIHLVDADVKLPNYEEIYAVNKHESGTVLHYNPKQHVINMSLSIIPSDIATIDTKTGQITVL